MQEHSSMSSKGRLLRVMAKQQIDSNRRGRFHKLKKSHLAPGGNIGTIWNLCILQLTSAHAFAMLRHLAPSCAKVQGRAGECDRCSRKGPWFAHGLPMVSCRRPVSMQDIMAKAEGWAVDFKVFIRDMSFVPVTQNS